MSSELKKAICSQCGSESVTYEAVVSVGGGMSCTPGNPPIIEGYTRWCRKCRKWFCGGCISTGGRFKQAREEGFSTNPMNHCPQCGADFFAPSNCFIATAATGSPSTWQVIALRGFRDQVMTRYSSGLTLIRLYSRASPPFAAWLEQHPVAKQVVRVLLVNPAATLVRCCRNRSR